MKAIQGNKYVKLGTYNFEIVKDYTYLGTILTNENELNQRLKQQLRMPIDIIKTLLRPVAMYRAESWTLNKDIAKQLATFERKILRRVFGGIKVNESWRQWYNKWLMQLFGDLDLLTFVRISRLNQIGHVNRMNSNRKISI